MNEIHIMASNISIGGIGLLGGPLKNLMGPLGGILYNTDKNLAFRNMRFHGTVKHVVEPNIAGVKFSWLSPIERMELNKLLKELQKQA